MASSSPPRVLPYYAVIFTSKRRDDKGYEATAQEMYVLATRQPGYLGLDGIGNGQSGISISYWQSLEDIRAWKQSLAHIRAQQQGQDKWYEEYQVHICKVERSYGFSAKL